MQDAARRLWRRTENTETINKVFNLYDKLQVSPPIFYLSKGRIQFDASFKSCAFSAEICKRESGPGDSMEKMRAPPGSMSTQRMKRSKCIPNLCLSIGWSWFYPRVCVPEGFGLGTADASHEILDKCFAVLGVRLAYVRQ